MLTLDKVSSNIDSSYWFRFYILVRGYETGISINAGEGSHIIKRALLMSSRDGNDERALRFIDKYFLARDPDRSPIALFKSLKKLPESQLIAFIDRLANSVNGKRESVISRVSDDVFSEY